MWRVREVCKIKQDYNKMEGCMKMGETIKIIEIFQNGSEAEGLASHLMTVDYLGMYE